MTPHVTLLLGAGGPVGRAFHAGVLHALADVCGWDARRADAIIGTSAGAQVGALLRAGWDSNRLLLRATRETAAPPRPRRRRRWPSSPAYLRAIARRPWQARPGPLVAALLPEGDDDTHFAEAFHRLFAGPWPHRPLWIPAVHADSGARVVFGRPDAPHIDVATAVRCSSAVPGVRPAVAVHDARYVNGGIHSPTHADLALETAPAERRRTIVVLSPLSCFLPMRWLLRWELAPAVRRGIDVLLFEPDRAVADVMGWNPMDARRASAVADATYRGTRRRLERGDAAATVRLLVGM